jgi:hypothetical protein
MELGKKKGDRAKINVIHVLLFFKVDLVAKLSGPPGWQRIVCAGVRLVPYLSLARTASFRPSYRRVQFLLPGKGKIENRLVLIK